MDSLCVKVLAPAFVLVVSYGMSLVFASHCWEEFFLSESRVGLVWEMCGRFIGFHPTPPGSKVSSPQL